MVTILFFASIKDKVGKGSLEIKIPHEMTISELMKNVAEITGVDPTWLISDRFIYAVNQSMEDKNCLVRDGDEVALLPPLSGGV